MMLINFKKKILIIVVAITVISLLVIGILSLINTNVSENALENTSVDTPNNISENISEKVLEKAPEKCPITKETKIVNGVSMDSLLKNGEEIQVLIGYYSCNDPKRGDIVLYDYSGDKNPLIKRIMGVPSDKFSLIKKEDGTSNILVNDKTLENSEGNEYVLDDRAAKMISLYINEYKGVIPQDTYLLLGNQAGGSLDSTRFGLVSKKDIIGKMEL